MQRIVIVGAGLAGAQAAAGLRKEGYGGELVMLGAEPHPPYDRPPLSKRFLLDAEPYDSTLPFDPSALGLDLRVGTRATGLSDSAVITDAGPVSYDGLVIASGSEPVGLPGEDIAGAAAGRVLNLRTRDDAAALRAALEPDRRVVIVGAGWIGGEVATAAARNGCRVTVVEQAAAPVSHALPPEIGAWLTGWYTEAGIDLRCGSHVETVAPDHVLLAGGERLAADAVVVGIGVRPATGWLAEYGPQLDNGVLVDAGLRSSLPDVVAVGDVAARWSPRYDTRIRGEHWDDALRAPAVAAANLLGGDQTYDPVPYVWSEQFGRMVQYAGRPGAGVRRIEREPERSAFWLDGANRIVGVLAVDQPRDFVQGRKLATTGSPVDPDRLADPGTPVKLTRADMAG